MDPKLLEKFIKVTNSVYGTGARPKPYKDNKSRYLWTDAFGVCNFLTLYHETKNEEYVRRADSLIKDVHDTLGKTRKVNYREQYHMRNFL